MQINYVDKIKCNCREWHVWENDLKEIPTSKFHKVPHNYVTGKSCDKLTVYQDLGLLRYYDRHEQQEILAEEIPF